MQWRDDSLEATWRSPDTPHLPAHHHPALLIELAHARGIPEHRLLRHTGLFPEDMRRGEAMLSDRQYRRLIGNILEYDTGGELALVWGRQSLPGHYGPPSTQIHNAPNLAEALNCLHHWRHQLSPLLTPLWWHNRQWCYLLWTTAGAGRRGPFLVPAAMAAVYGLARHRLARSLDWHFLFAAPRPTSPQPYEVNLGPTVRFGAGVDMVVLPVEDLYEPWPGRSQTAFTAAAHEAERVPALNGAGPTLPEVVYQSLAAHPETPAGLDDTAGALGLSPSSLKRHLRDYDSRFQALYDEVRLHHSLYLHQVMGLSMEGIAERLSHGDRANFRRSFRRWTGLSPAQYQRLLPE
ncbi:AraC family transcriptional regulator [Vreelandella utahensis]|uniref:AraC family transcriptional regulator n=1 Tax=Vreelandella halophila TaxID=86177 RepID=UPI000984D493|nr:AraC family transcriptional regulator [Halomonas utahensis]